MDWLALLFNMWALIGFALYSKKEEPGIELYLAERVANMEINGLVTSRLKPS
jgi:hypothetical protein